MFQELELRNGERVSNIILNITTVNVDDLLSEEDAKEDVSGAFAIGFLVSLVKEGAPITDSDTVQLLINRRLLEQDGSVRPDIHAVIDALFEGSGLAARRVSPLAE